MTGPGQTPGRSNHSARIPPRMPCLKERKTDSRTYAALPIAVAINGRNPLLSAESVSPFEEILLE